MNMTRPVASSTSRFSEEPKGGWIRPTLVLLIRRLEEVAR
jgi:hypothetical protein